MTGPVDEDLALREAAALLQGLPHEQPPASLAADLVAKARPLAARRRRVMLGLATLALLAVAAYAAVLLSTLQEVPS